MYRDPMDDIFESFVRAAVIENGLKESEAYPQNDALCDIHLSSKCERSVSRNACRIKRKKKLLKMSKYMQKTVAAVMITIGVSFGFFLSSNEVRSSCYDVMLQVYDEFVDVNMGQNNSAQAMLNISFIPEGYKEIGRAESTLKGFVEYENTLGEVLTLRYTNGYANLKMDNEHYIIEDNKLSVGNGTLFIARDSKFPNILFWKADTYNFTLQAFLPEDELIKISKNSHLSVRK